jgi:hypothetical protein
VIGQGHARVCHFYARKNFNQQREEYIQDEGNARVEDEMK